MSTMKSNKELKEQYLQQKAKIGVYQIRNTVNGKIFLGSGMNLDALKNRNRMELNLGSHRNEALQKDGTRGFEQYAVGSAAVAIFNASKGGTLDRPLRAIDYGH